METVWLEVSLIVLGIIANGFFAGTEIALVSSRKSRLTQLAQTGNIGASVALKLKDGPDSFLATIQIAITVVGTLASAVGGATAVEVLTPRLSILGGWAEPAALGIVILCITYFSLVIGELAPKAIALRNPERFAAFGARPILWLSRMAGGAVRLLTASTNVLLRVIGVSSTPESVFVSEDDVRYLVREGAARGVFEKVEQELVENVFRFTNTTVRELMVPRMKIQGLEVTTPPDEVLSKAAAIGHSWMPIYRGSVENIVGVVSIKDLLKAFVGGRRLELVDLAREPLFVPESADVSRLLRELQRMRQHLAMVVDEYGGIAGLVTVEDAVGRIVGEIRESDRGEAPFVRLPDGAILIDGTARVEEVTRSLGIPIEESPEYTTVAGYILTSLNTMPTVGATMTRDGYRWTVLHMDGPRIAKVKIEPVSPPQPSTLNAPDPRASKVALVTAAATFGTFGVALFFVADVSRFRVLRWSAGIMVVVIAVAIVVHLMRRRQNR
jgi:putative hemolysin